jgi:hypothetical protein
MRDRPLQGDRGIAGSPPARTLSACVCPQLVGLSGQTRRATSKMLSSESSCDQFQPVVHQQNCLRLRIIPQTVDSIVPCVFARLSAYLPVNGSSEWQGDPPSSKVPPLRWPAIALCMLVLLTRRMDTLFSSLQGAKPYKLIRSTRPYKLLCSSRLQTHPQTGGSLMPMGGHPSSASVCLTPDETIVLGSDDWSNVSNVSTEQLADSLVFWLIMSPGNRCWRDFPVEQVSASNH